MCAPDITKKKRKKIYIGEQLQEHWQKVTQRDVTHEAAVNPQQQNKTSQHTTPSLSTASQTGTMPRWLTKKTTE